jgi:catechol 2,3-dioxygenase-like lactoylglutathione lyase family enzyme
MTLQAKYVHTNLIAQDWRKLAQFYVDVFGCQPLLPERHIDEPWLAQATALPGARIDGVHLRLPGWGESGPTLEIFQYTPEKAPVEKALNRPGYGHIAFAVEDVAGGRAAVLAAGGSAAGEMVSIEVAGAGWIEFVYLRDPEGNLIELQNWKQKG